jgi:hypothetical protein
MIKGLVQAAIFGSRTDKLDYIFWDAAKESGFTFSLKQKDPPERASLRGVKRFENPD